MLQDEKGRSIQQLMWDAVESNFWMSGAIWTNYSFQTPPWKVESTPRIQNVSIRSKMENAFWEAITTSQNRLPADEKEDSTWFSLVSNRRWKFCFPLSFKREEQKDFGLPKWLRCSKRLFKSGGRRKYFRTKKLQPYIQIPPWFPNLFLSDWC